MIMEIDTSSRSSQVKASLLKYIEQLQLEDKNQLPSETVIAKTLGVSRNTLREAYIELENAGVIIRRHGIGTFVARSHVIRDSLNDFSPFAQIINEGGFIPSFHTLSIDHVEALSEVASTFSLPASKNVLLIKRIVRADQQPAIYIEDYIHPLLDAGQLDWNAFDGNLINFLTSSLNTSFHHLQSKIRAAALPPEISHYLELSVGTPILSVRSIIYKDDNRPVVFSKIYYNSNFVELTTVRMIH